MNKTAISILQEFVVERKEKLPDYNIENYNGLPGVSFKCTVIVGQLKAVGYASTKKDAKQKSAQKALELLGFYNTVQQQILPEYCYQSTSNSHKNIHVINYVGKLNELASTNGKSYPNYYEAWDISGSRFITRCSFLKWTTEGHGFKKKDSKQDAAKKMLDKLETENISSIIKSVEVLELNQIDKIKKLNQEVLKNYEKLASSVNNAVSELTEFLPIPNLKKKVTSMEELKIELKKYGYKYKLETFQKEPYIVMMKINDTRDAILMGRGDTREEAMQDLFESATYMFGQGFSISPEL